MIPHEHGLRIHVINVGHGDAILVELPDRDGHMRFGMVDAGERGRKTRKARDYLKAFVDWRMEGASPEGSFEFFCLSHPHDDHFTGVMPVLEWAGSQGMHPREFWDSGFRSTSVGYLTIMDYICEHDDIRFMRVTSGTEFHYGPVEVMVLAPSVDLRNRFDTYGVEENDASIVLRVRLGEGSAILAGDAEYHSWGKITEEFPRTSKVTYPKAESKTAEQLIKDIKGDKNPNLFLQSKISQLSCNLLKVAHHGSMNGTSFQYLEKMSPQHYAITCAKDYTPYGSKWQGSFPHPLTRVAIAQAMGRYDKIASDVPSLENWPEVGMCYDRGSMVFTMGPRGVLSRHDLGEGRKDPVTPDMLDRVLG